MLGLGLRQKRTKIEDIIIAIANAKWIWTRHVAKQERP